MTRADQQRARRERIAKEQGLTVRTYTPTISPQMFSIDKAEWRRLYKQTQRRDAGVLSREEGKAQTVAKLEALKADKDAARLHDSHVRCFKRDTNGYARWKTAHIPKYAMYQRLKRWMSKHIRDRTPSKKWMHFLGYTPQELVHHLEKQFTKGMGWHNKGDWHIDHIRPVTSFNIDGVDCPSFKDCFGLANLRPIWAEENLKKSDKLEFLL